MSTRAPKIPGLRLMGKGYWLQHNYSLCLELNSWHSWTFLIPHQRAPWELWTQDAPSAQMTHLSRARGSGGSHQNEGEPWSPPYHHIYARNCSRPQGPSSEQEPDAQRACVQTPPSGAATKMWIEPESYRLPHLEVTWLCFVSKAECFTYKIREATRL